MKNLKSILGGLALAAMTTISVTAAPFQADGTPRTSDNQKNNKADINLTASIRKDIVADKSLSTAAHNIKVISENGTVTVRGDVNSDAEKNTVLTIAKKYAGASNVMDQVTVAPPK